MSTQLEAVAGKKVMLRYGGPFRGYNAALARHLIGNDQLAVDSLNWFLDSAEGKLVRRQGVLLLLDNVLEAGITSPTYEFRGAQVGEFRGAHLFGTRDANPAVLFTDERVDATSYGVYGFYDSVAGLWRVLGYSNSAYPANGTVGNKPTVEMAGPRFRAAADRIRCVEGGRNFLDVGNWVCWPAYGSRETGGAETQRGIPGRWNKTWPNAPVPSESYLERVRPLGHQPPMWMPRITVPAAPPAGTPTPWASEDLFYISLQYVFEDGSTSPPIWPRQPDLNFSVANVGTRYSPVGVGGFGLVRLGGAGVAYSSITWSGIPVPPAGVKKVRLLRSPKVNGATAGAIPDPSDLRLVADGELRAGTTTFVDTGGLDASLTVDALITRTDATWAPRCRSLFNFDQRIGAGYVRDPIPAILITYQGSGDAGWSHNLDDDVITGLANDAAYVVLSGTSLDLYHDNVAAAVTNRRRYDLSTGSPTIQEIVDRINSQNGQVAATGDAVADRWYAQLVPGANGQIPATNLRVTSGDYGDNFTTGAASPAAVPNGAAITNVFRTWGPGWPGLLLFSIAYLNTLPFFKNAFMFTTADPGNPPMAANSWRATNFVTMPAGSGYFQAGGGLTDGALIFGSQGLCRFVNVREGNTGSDADYRIVLIDQSRGAISHQVAQGPGFWVYLSDTGLIAHDGRQELLISETLYNPASRTGDLAYEIQQCQAATAADKHVLGYFNVLVAESRIWISYRSSASVTRPDRHLVMDFSPGSAASGLEALIDPRTKQVFGWSTPYKYGDQSNVAPSAMGLLRTNAGGIKLFCTRDRHTAAAIEGRVEQFDTGNDDNATVIAPVSYYKTELIGDGRHLIASERVRIRYKKNGTGLTVSHARDANAHTANPSRFRDLALASSGTDLITNKLWELPTAARTLAAALELKIADDGTTTDRPEAFGFEVEAEILNVVG